jgi:hypothetical protein
MADFRNKLGPQGRALLGNQIQYQEGPNHSVPQELDFLINDLRSPAPDATVSKVLGYLYHYLPYVKYEHNLRLVFASFLNSPVCFGSQPASFDQNYLIIEVFKLVTDKKLKVSQPTLPIKTFYTVILKEITNFVAFNPVVNSWKVLPIIAGLLLSNELRDQLYTLPNALEYKWFFRDWDEKSLLIFKKALSYSISAAHHDDIVFLSILSLAATFKKNDNVHSYTKTLADDFIVSKIIELMFVHPQTSLLTYSKFFHLNASDPNAESVIQQEILQNPVIKHVNRFSFLLDSYFKHFKYTGQNFRLIIDKLVVIERFNSQLAHSVQASEFNNSKSPISANIVHQQFWVYMKSVLFAQTVIFEGILTRFVTSNRNYTIYNPFQRKLAETIECEYKEISLKLLQSLYHLNFILLSIGQGGFDNYNFVYYLSIELALNTGHGFEQLSQYLIGNYNEVNLYPDVVNNDYIVRSRVLYVLGLWENYLQLKNKREEFVKNEIFDICINLADDAKYQDNDLIEASHSVLLLCFSSGESIQFQGCIMYVELLLEQFPSRLSSTQLSIAIETIGKKILSYPKTSQDFFEFLVSKYSTARPGIMILRQTSQTMKDLTFTSAQPILEIDAHSTLSSMDQNLTKESNIIEANKAKKPKDMLFNEKKPANYEFQNRSVPETLREALLTSLINLVPYFPLTEFNSWLNKIWSLVQESNRSESIYLTTVLWQVLSENLDLNRCELGYRWWYQTKEVPQMSTIKLIDSHL